MEVIREQDVQWTSALNQSKWNGEREIMCGAVNKYVKEYTDKRENPVRIHFSIDDFFDTLKELTLKEDQYDSIFSHPVFCFFREMHEKYHTVFHCFCFGENKDGSFSLADVTRKYRKEFEENAAWLQFGFHAMNTNVVYGDNNGSRVINRDAKQAAEDYRFVMENLVQIVGEQSLDLNPRIHFFAGTKECCEAWKEAQHGVKGLLAADDDRYSYYHNKEQRDILLKENVWYDAELDLLFRRTNIRLENEKDETQLIRKIREFTGEEQVIFTHEYYLGQEEMRRKIEICLREIC